VFASVAAHVVHARLVDTARVDAVAFVVVYARLDGVIDWSDAESV
jgi:hypothetical protein